MVKIYADLVEQGYRTLEEKEGIIQVPSVYRDGVKKELINRGVIAD